MRPLARHRRLLAGAASQQVLRLLLLWCGPAREQQRRSLRGRATAEVEVQVHLFRLVARILALWKTQSCVSRLREGMVQVRARRVRERIALPPCEVRRREGCVGESASVVEV
jgi:hypothetical protein